MRLKILGLRRLAFFIFGFLPGITWILFHFRSLPFLRPIDWIGYSVIFSFLGLVFFYLSVRGIFRVRLLTYVVLFSEIIIEMFAAVGERSFQALAIALVAFGVACILSFWLERQLNSASINPRVNWVDGSPSGLPRVKLNLAWGEVSVPAEVRGIDFGGFFAFLPSDRCPKGREVIKFELNYQNLSVQGEARVRSLFFGEKFGLGLQFSPKDLYHFNEYTALVQRLRGEGLLS